MGLLDSIPLPRQFTQDPEGGLAHVFNSLLKGALENKYYGPTKKSEIGYRNSMTQGQNIENKYMPEKLQLANKLSQQKFEWNPRNWQSENAFRNANTNETNAFLFLNFYTIL